MDRAAGVAAAEPDPVLLRAAEVGDRDDVPGAAGELDELGQDAAAGDVERDVDAAGCERADPPQPGGGRMPRQPTSSTSFPRA